MKSFTTAEIMDGFKDRVLGIAKEKRVFLLHFPRFFVTLRRSMQ